MNAPAFNTAWKIEEAESAIRHHFGVIEARVAVILGSGLGGLTERLEETVSLPYDQMPHWSRSTCAGHRGRLVMGKLDGVPVIALDGRLHRYEGWSVAQITFPVEVLSALGVETLVVSNAAGGVAPRYRVGDVVILCDHIDWQWGTVCKRFDGTQSGELPVTDVPCRGSPYDAELIELALETARRENFSATCGVYLATIGPNYETRAEYRMMRRMGADLVGMSTVPEVLAARRLGMRVLAMSMVSNLACPDTPVKADHDEVLAAGLIAEAKMTAIVRALLRAEVGCIP